MAPSWVGLSWGRGRGRKLAKEAWIGGWRRAESVAPHPKDIWLVYSFDPFRSCHPRFRMFGLGRHHCVAERREAAENGGELRRTSTHLQQRPSAPVRRAPQFSAAPSLSLRGRRCGRPNRLGGAMVSRATKAQRSGGVGGGRSAELTRTPPPQSGVCF